MAEWLDRLVRRLTPADKKPIILLDPGQVLRYPECLSRLKEAEYQAIYAEPGLDFRFKFELLCRHKHQVLLVVEEDYEPLPDIASDAVVIKVNLREVFPHFEAKALQGLSFNALCTVDSLRIFEVLGYDRTIHFLLENLYQIDLFALKSHQTKERVLGILVQVLNHRDPPNQAIFQYLKTMARTVFNPQIAIIVADPGSLREYLQTEWQKMTQGASTLDFTDPVLEKAVNQLFVTGILKPVKVESTQLQELGLNHHLGLEIDAEGTRNQRFEQLLAHLEERLGNIQNQYTEWQNLSPILGEAGVMADLVQDETLSSRYRLLIQQLNQRFQIFVQQTYNSIQSLSGTRNPATIHKIMDYIRAQSTSQTKTKKAFILIDGMSVIQWYLLRTVLCSSGLEVQDLASFAWLPSITAWSRQAFFRGAKPDITTDNSKEEQLFRDYWAKNGELSYQVEYSVFAVNKPPQLPSQDTNVAAYVCNDLDNLMHGAIMGTPQLHQNTQQWIDHSNIQELVTNLKKMGFIVCITSDHGNISALGQGGLKLPDRQTSKSRSKRHLQCVNSEEALRFKNYHSELSLSIRDNSVFFTDDSAFDSESASIITHGGSHLLELLIPVGVIL